MSLRWPHAGVSPQLLVVVALLALLLVSTDAKNAVLSSCLKSSCLYELSAQDKDKLCKTIDELDEKREREEGIARAQCFESLSNSLDNELAIKACSSSSNASAVMKCVESRLEWTQKDKFELCSGAHGSGPEECAKASLDKLGMLGENKIARLCQQQPFKYLGHSDAGEEKYGLGSIRCFKQATEGLFLSEEHAVSLCQYLDDERPIECVKAAQTNYMLTDSVRVAVCASAQHPVAAGTCASKCHTKTHAIDAGIQAKVCERVCNSAKFPQAGECLSALLRSQSALEQAFGNSHTEEEILDYAVALCGGKNGLGGEHAVKCLNSKKLERYKDTSGKVTEMPTLLRVYSCAGVTNG